MGTRRNSRGYDERSGTQSFSKPFLVAITVIFSATALIVGGVAAYSFFAADFSAPVYNESSAPTDSGSQATQDPGILDMLDESVIYQNIFVNGIEVSGLSKAEAEMKLSEFFDRELSDSFVNYDINGINYKFSYKDLGCVYDVASVVNEAYSYARNGSYSERYELVSELLTKRQDFTADLIISGEGIEDAFDEIKSEIETPPAEQSFVRIDGEFVITPGHNGLLIDMERLVADTRSLIEGKTDSAAPILITVKESGQKYGEIDFSRATSLLGSFSTSFSPGDDGRNQNLKNAASKLNDVVLMPGEEFSTNDAFGEMTFENGYAIGKAIVGGVLVDDIGGGVCQVSSTLYNALLYAEIEITQRQNHSQKVGYLDWAFDATLASPSIDLKFRNNTDYPLTLESYISNNKVCVNVYGYEKHSSTRTLVFENALLETISPPAEEIVDDPTLPFGQRVVVTGARTGYRYALYKLIYENGVFVEKQQVNTSTYRASRAKVRVGTGPAETPIETTPSPTPTPETPVPQTEAPTMPPTEGMTEPPYVEEPDPFDGLYIPEDYYPDDYLPEP